MRSKPKILVTGGAGYLGSIVSAYLSKSNDVTVVDSFLYGQKRLESPGVVKEDIRNFRAMKKFLDNADVLVHLAGIVGEQACNIDHDLALQVNFLASRELVKYCGQNEVKVVYPSSCSVYGFGDGVIDEDGRMQPLSLYAVSKVAEENAVQLACSNFIIFRLGTLFGYSPRMRFDLVVNRLIAQAMFDKRITVYGGLQWRPFVHVVDVARALDEAIVRDVVGVLNFGGTNITIADLAGSISKQLRCEVVTYPEIQDRRDYRVDSSRAYRLLGFAPSLAVEDAVEEIKSAVDRGEISSYKDKRYSNDELLRSARQ